MEEHTTKHELVPSADTRRLFHCSFCLLLEYISHKLLFWFMLFTSYNYKGYDDI